MSVISDDTERRDLAIVGAGPCGIATGVAARDAGLDAVLYDRGCLVQSLVDYPTYMTFFSTPERLEIGRIPFVVADAKPTRREALAYYRAVAARHELVVRQYEAVISAERHPEGFAIASRDGHGRERLISARAVVVATGAMHEPNRLEVVDDGSGRIVHRYREGHPYADQDVVVVGGGSSAVEAALDLYRSGARVTLVHFEDRFDRGVKPWILPDIRNRIDAGDIDVRWRHRVVGLPPGGVKLRAEDGGPGTSRSGAAHARAGAQADAEAAIARATDARARTASHAGDEELPNDWVFAMTGWKPDHSLMESLGVEIDGDTGIPEHDPRTMETNVGGVFVAGVITAGFDANKVFIENGRHHGDLITAAVVARSG